MPDRPANRLLSGFRVTSLGTLASRVLGLVRDVATAALLGASGGPVDALLVAVQIPNLFRRLFVEGALTAAYLPQLAAALEKDREAARRLAGTSLLTLSVLMAVAVLGLEVLLSTSWATRSDPENLPHVARLTAILLPYVLLVGVTAQLAATLHGLRHFTWPALAPVVLNVVWLIALCLVAPAVSDKNVDQVYVVAWGIVVAGVLQSATQLAALWRLRFLPTVDFSRAWPQVKKIIAATLPAMLALAALHINTFIDAWTAWCFSATDVEGAMTNVAWLSQLGLVVPAGAASLLYYSERLFMLPVALVGLAAATAVYPQLAADAAAGRIKKASDDVSLGLRLIFTLAVPASAGLVLLAGPIIRLMLEHGEFNAEQAQRAAGMIAMYGGGVWAFCAVPLVVRALLAFGDTRRAAVAAVIAVGLNVCLNLPLTVWLGEVGLVAATVAGSVVQLVVLVTMLDRKHAVLKLKPLAYSLARTLLSTAIMVIAGVLVLPFVAQGSDDLASRVAAVAVPMLVCISVYFGMHVLLGGSGLRVVTEALSRSDEESK